MTDRFAGCVVTFDRDIREDDVKGLFDAIGRIRGVVAVEPRRADAWTPEATRERERCLKILRNAYDTMLREEDR